MLGCGGQTQPDTGPHAGLEWEKAGVWDTDNLSQALSLPKSTALAHYPMSNSPNIQREQTKKSPLPLICHLLAPQVAELKPSSHSAQNLQFSLLQCRTSVFHRCTMSRRMNPAVFPSLGIFLVCILQCHVICLSQDNISFLDIILIYFVFDLRFSVDFSLCLTVCYS